MLETKAFKPGHVCEHVCDTFMGCSVRSRDVKSVPPVVLSKSKGGMEEGIPQLGLGLQILSKCCWRASPHPSSGAAGKFGVQTSSQWGFHVSSAPQILTAELRSALRMGGWAASCSSVLMRENNQ